MKKSKTDNFFKYTYRILLAVALFTGFGNMPIYKRYYISDIPGMGWAGNFFTNLNVHYIAGALLLGLAFYFALVYLKKSAYDSRLTASGALRAAFLGAALLSGILLAVRNLRAIHFSLSVQLTVIFIHLGMAMIVLIMSIGCGIAKIPWIRHTDIEH